MRKFVSDVETDDDVDGDVEEEDDCSDDFHDHSDDNDNDDVCKGQHVHSTDTALHRRVSRITDRVVRGAKSYCEARLAETSGAIEQLDEEVIAHKVRVLELRKEEHRWIQVL